MPTVLDVILSKGDTVHSIGPTESVIDAVHKMNQFKIGCLMVMQGDQVMGIFTERDVLTRVVGARRDPARTVLADVMTPEPEALTSGHRVAYALHCMSVAGYRTVPLVDDEARVIGVITATDIVTWLASLFPEEILNLPPGGRIKHPEKIDAG